MSSLEVSLEVSLRMGDESLNEAASGCVLFNDSSKSGVTVQPVAAAARLKHKAV